MKRLLALTLALCLLLSGCLPYRIWKRLLRRGDGVLENAALQAADACEQDGDMPRFSELPYESPDEQALREVFETARAMAEEGGDADELMDTLDRAFAAYDDFYTLDTIAMIHADADQTDEYWAREFDRCERLIPQVEQWYSQMLQACAGSPRRRTMEFRGYFAPGELDYYEEDDYPDELVALMEKESDLEAEFRALGEDFDLDGEQMNLSEYLAREDLSEDEYARVYTAYLKSVNAEAARIYAELIGVRELIAAAWDYDSYEQYCYDYYSREYTPEDVNAYLADVRNSMGPYHRSLLDSGEYDKLEYPPLSEQELMRNLERVMSDLGTPANIAFDFMERYDLCDIRADLRKASISYTAYLYSYYAPYLFVDAYGDVEDLVDTAHEFGHFLAAYVQGYGGSASLDLDETLSQGMEYLTLTKLRDTLTRPRYEALLRIKLLDTLDTYTEQAAWAAFEHAAYALPEDERTAERFNELSAECLREYGCSDTEYDVLWWTQIDHLFQAPFYMVSYSVSVDAAMQIYELALEDPEKAWGVYRALLDAPDLAFSDALEGAGLESPFAPGRAERARQTIEAQLPK